MLSLLVPSAEFEVAADEATAAVVKAAQRAFGPTARVLPYGSLVQGTHIQGSDMDLCVHAPCWNQSSCLRQLDNSTQVLALKKLVRELPDSFHVVEMRFSKHIRVPIVVLRFISSKGQEVETDISMGIAFDGVQKGRLDKMIRRALMRVPQALPFIQLVKHWARSEGLNKAYEGFLNSLGWALLVLHWFTKEGAVNGSLFDAEGDMPLALNDKGWLSPPLESGTIEALSRQDLADFFRMVADYEELLSRQHSQDSGAWGVSLVDTRPVQGPADDTSPFFLEDPGARLACGRLQNVARALRMKCWKTILRKCRAAATALCGDETTAASWAHNLALRAEAEKHFSGLHAEASCHGFSPAGEGGTRHSPSSVKRPCPREPLGLHVSAPPAKRLCDDRARPEHDSILAEVYPEHSHRPLARVGDSSSTEADCPSSSEAVATSSRGASTGPGGSAWSWKR